MGEKESDGEGSHDEDGEPSEEVSGDEGSQLIDEATPPPAPREEEPKEEELPRVGLSANNFMSAGAQNITHNTQPMARGLGFNRGGIGSSKSLNVSDEPATSSSVPSAFGARQLRSFVRESSDSTPTSRAATPNLTREEKLHFNKLQNSFGAKMMAKMGWQSVRKIDIFLIESADYPIFSGNGFRCHWRRYRNPYRDKIASKSVNGSGIPWAQRANESIHNRRKTVRSQIS